MTNTKPIPKSLHTITVFINVAKLLRTHNPKMTKKAAIRAAVRNLGYALARDPYDLASKALILWEKQDAKAKDTSS